MSPKSAPARVGYLAPSASICKLQPSWGCNRIHPRQYVRILVEAILAF